MREIGACLYRDNEERIDPDRDFSHIDKRIQDVLGQYQKDFMGEVSADNLGARWGGYGSFLPVTRCSSAPIITRPPPHLSSRSPHNSTSEVRQSLTIQANESTNVRPRPGIPPSSGQSTSKLENAVDDLKNEPKAVPVDLSDNNISKMITDNAVDNSAIYSGLGLDISPSSSFEDSPLNINGTPSCSQGLPENSPSYIIKVMTSLPVTGGKLMSPLSERFVSLTKKEINQDRNLPRVETSLKTEHELVSSEIVLKERKLKQGNRSKVSEFEDHPSITGLPSKIEDSKISKGKEIITENPVDTDNIHLDKKKDHISRSSYPFNQRNGAEKVDSQASPVSTDFIHSDKKSTSTFKEKGNSSRASYPLSKKNGAPKLVDKQSQVKEEPPSEQVNSFEEKEIPAGFSDKIQRDMKATTVIKNGNAYQNSKRFSEPKTKVKEELPEPFSSQDHKQQQKMKIHNDRKPNSIVERDLDDKKQIKNEEPLEGKKVKKERLSSSESKKKIRKSRESVVLPKLSFKVGSSAAAAFSQQTDCGSDEVRKVIDKSSDVTSNATPKKKEKFTASKDPIIGVGKREKQAIGIQVKDNKPDSSQFQYPKAEDPIGNNNPYSMEKVPTETAPVVIEEDWVLCDKCEAWRLLPPNIKPSDLPLKWHCSMLTWLPGMNKCSFTEAETTSALHALYQLPPAAVNNALIPQTKEPPPLLVAAIDSVADSLKRGSKRLEITTDTVESAKKHKPIQLRSGPGKQVVVVGKKREGSIDTHGALKKVKRDSQQFAKDRNSTVPLAMEIGNATLNDDDSSQVPKDLVNHSKKNKGKAQRTVTKEDERKDISARKRKSRDPTEIVPSSGAPSNDIRREKRQKLELNLQEKERSTTKPNDKNDGGEQGNSQKTGRREDRNTPRKTVDGKKLSRSDKELKMPALTAATSSSSKISSTCRVKMKSQPKSSPVGSISSSPMRVSRSNHDRNRDQKHELSATKNKNLEATDANKQIGIKLKDKSVDVLGLDKIISDNLLPERFRSEQDQAGSSIIRDHPSSSTQLLDFSKIVGLNATSSHDESKKKLPSQQLIGDEARASTSAVRKDNSDRAARAALKEAKDLKHSANRLKINGSGLSTEVFFQAALKFLNGASLLEFDSTEGSGSSDMKPSDVYRSTAKLCFYCALEFEKQNDMASVALAYKCMEVAYMRVVYYSDVVASRDRHELNLAQREVPQVVESPSSSASDVDNVNNPTSNGVVVKPTQSSANHGNYVIAAANRPSFDRILKFAEDVNLAMDAARRSQNAFTAARSTLTEAGNEEGITAIKRVLDFSFHDVDELLYRVRLAMEATANR